MAKSINNVVMQGVSGTIGKMLVFRTNAAGKTIVARRPKRSSKPLTEAQLETINRFTEAAYYAKSAIADPELKAAYQAKAKPGQSAYNMAFSDFLKAPALRKLTVDSYNGALGDKITVRLIDNFKILAVAIRIIDANDQMLEQGLATPLTNGLDWEYTAVSVNENVVGSNIEVTATDTPGNVVTFNNIISN